MLCSMLMVYSLPVIRLDEFFAPAHGVGSSMIAVYRSSWSNVSTYSSGRTSPCRRVQVSALKVRRIGGPDVFSMPCSRHVELKRPGRSQSFRVSQEASFGVQASSRVKTRALSSETNRD
ncbi:hypothetical protein R1flu_004741 [Riccia fluitans]|uniref:Secreted protein n=1 Tax=Riccia fluitans TaxID=41844 RepID=A0ABD1YV59_9MARC